MILIFIQHEIYCFYNCTTKHLNYNLNSTQEKGNATYSTVEKAMENCINIVLLVEENVKVFDSEKRLAKFNCRGYSMFYLPLAHALHACVQRNEGGAFSCRTDMPSDLNDYINLTGNYSRSENRI